MKALQEIATELKKAKDILIGSHLNPDGDCIGSTLGLTLALRQHGCRAIPLNADPLPEMYGFLPGSQAICRPQDLEEVPPILVAVDCTDLDRIAEGFVQWQDKFRLIINIDHHASNSFFGHLNLVDSQAAATGELVYYLLQAMDIAISPDVATCLYTALVTDTGSFQYENTGPRTHRLAASLLEAGANLGLIREHLWESKPLSGIQLLGQVLPTLTLAFSGKVAYIYVKETTLAALQANGEHIEGLVNYPRSISGVEVALLFREMKPEVIKVSLRSKKYVDVNLIAQRFGGGGHHRAAGCTLKAPLAEAISQVLTVVGEFL
ncbi:MAG: bifunctional oligoribonuclease and phosphatase NrnA [Clostridia bacterium]|nr:bifunctional oligoribonuclease and phosphatase NrnA [Clostridia bacterium]